MDYQAPLAALQLQLQVFLGMPNLREKEDTLEYQSQYISTIRCMQMVEMETEVN